MHVDSSAWLQQIEFLRPAILEKLSPFGVSGVRFMLGRLSERDSRPAEAPAQPLKLTEEDRALIEQCVALISDETIQDTLRRAMQHSIGRPRVKQKHKT